VVKIRRSNFQLSNQARDTQLLLPANQLFACANRLQRRLQVNAFRIEIYPASIRGSGVWPLPFFPVQKYRDAGAYFVCYLIKLLEQPPVLQPFSSDSRHCARRAKPSLRDKFGRHDIRGIEFLDMCALSSTAGNLLADTAIAAHAENSLARR